MKWGRQVEEKIFQIHKGRQYWEIDIVGNMKANRIDHVPECSKLGNRFLFGFMGEKMRKTDNKVI